VDSAKTARLIYEMIRAAVAQHILEWPDEAVDETTELTLDLVLRGIAC
jgi:hypothetical protein